jgi:prevent-host-death family protein
LLGFEPVRLGGLAQVVTKRGQSMAVLVSMAEWNRLSQQTKPTLKALLQSDEARFDMTLPDRSQWQWQSRALDAV